MGLLRVVMAGPSGLKGAGTLQHRGRLVPSLSGKQRRCIEARAAVQQRVEAPGAHESPDLCDECPMPARAQPRLPANQAMRLGLRAASRNPELAFGKALLDLSGSVMSLLPVLLTFVLLSAFFGGHAPGRAFAEIVVSLQTLSWPLAGAAIAAALISLALSTLFWAGALPVLAADAELQDRPPQGTFAALAVKGFARLTLASAATSLLSFLLSASLSLGAFFLPLSLGAGRSLALPVLAAFAVAGSLVLALLLDLLLRLVLVRAAVFAEPVATAFVSAARLLGERLGTLLLLALLFFVLELLCAGAAGAINGFAAATADADGALLGLSLAPRIAVTIASGAVLAWLEVGRQGALAALTADAEGLIALPPEEEERAPAPLARRPSYRIPEPWELRPPPVAQQPVRRPPQPEPRGEPVIEAEPRGEPVIDAEPRGEPVIDAEPRGERVRGEPVIDAEPVIEALPVPQEPEQVIEALPVPDDDREPHAPQPEAGEAQQPHEGAGQPPSGGEGTGGPQ
jgi:hypothetical protein